GRLSSPLSPPEHHRNAVERLSTGDENFLKSNVRAQAGRCALECHSTAEEKPRATLGGAAGVVLSAPAQCRPDEWRDLHRWAAGNEGDRHTSSHRPESGAARMTKAELTIESNRKQD